MQTINIVNLVIAGAGLALSIANTSKSFIRDRVRLHVNIEDTPPHIKELNDRNPVLVKITNASLFPVTIDDILFISRKRKEPVAANFFVEDVSQWPKRLQQGEQYTAQIWKNSIERPGTKVDHNEVVGVCVQSASGKKFMCRSNMLSSYLIEK